MPEERIDLALELLDRQLLDSEGKDCGKVDDLEFEVGKSGLPVLTNILVGPGALGPAFSRWPGRVITAVWRRLHPNRNPEPLRIPWSDVERVDYEVHLTVQREEAGLTRSEDWARDILIGRIPGAES
jgi:sporulation protein YlmC with PRC-barrel domain